jgi:Lar family restriction alleviation protein
MAELKPCPFCGGEAKIRDFTIVDLEPEIDVFCTNCGGQTFVYGTEEEAIEAWNRRCTDGE